MLGGDFTDPPAIVAIGEKDMSSNTSRAQTRIDVENSDPIVIDAEGALDEVYGALANERRRHVLSVLVREPTPMNVGTLARQVTLQEACDHSKMVTEEVIAEVKISLHHNHLPKLADIGLITYDSEEKTVGGVNGTINLDDI